MSPYPFPFWKNNPFVRLFLPFATGIYLQWQYHLSNAFIHLLLFACLCIALALFFLPEKIKFRLGLMKGIPFPLLFLTTGAMITIQQDVRNRQNWFSNLLTPAS